MARNRDVFEGSDDVAKNGDCFALHAFDRVEEVVAVDREKTGFLGVRQIFETFLQSNCRLGILNIFCNFILLIIKRLLLCFG